jgi:pimeloyl-ACP methyl ester carboxylesterase
MSDDPPFGHRMARHGRALGDFLGAIGLPSSDKVVLVGGSMGASTIWSHVDLFGTSAVRGIVTIDQTPKKSNEADWPYGVYGYRADNLGTFFADGPPLETGHGTPIEQRGARLERLLAAYRPDSDDTHPSKLPTTALALLRDHAVQDWRDVIARLDIPSLLIAGRDSELWPREHAAAAASLNLLARAVVIEDCGHGANAEQPDVCNSGVIDFISRI